MHNKIWNDLEKVRKAKCLLTDMFEMELCTKGDNACLNELSGVSDMIKDFAETEEKCMKAIYYKELLDAMKEEREDDNEESMGYPRRSSTRMMRGTHRMGYSPMYNEHPYDDWSNGPMGYDHYRYASGRFAPTGHGHYSPGYTPQFMSDEMRYGTAYNEWKDAKKHYTVSSSSTDKDEMDRKGMEHTMNVIASIRDIWKHADPDMRKRMKADLTALISEMA